MTQITINNLHCSRVCDCVVVAVDSADFTTQQTSRGRRLKVARVDAGAFLTNFSLAAQRESSAGVALFMLICFAHTPSR